MAIHIGIILGSGIFVAPRQVSAALPGPGSAVLWIVGGLVAACGAFCYAECATRLPRTGGFYSFYREALGEAPAFVGGWAGFAVTYPASMAAISLVCAEYLGAVLPAARGHEPVAAAVALITAAALNVFGVRLGATTQRLLTGTKVAALAALCLAAVWAAGTDGAAGDPGGATAVPTPAVGLTVIVAALVAILWTYDGWSDITLVAGEIKDPGRTLGPAVAIGTTVLVALYVGVQLSVLALLGSADAARSDGVVAAAVSAGLGSGAGRLVAVLVVISTFGALHGVTLTASRLGFAMARDGVFPGALHHVHSRWGTPSRSIAVLGAAALVYALSSSFGTLLTYFTVAVWVFYALTAIAWIRLRRRGVGEPAAWRAPGGALAPAVVLVTGACVTGSLVVNDLRGSWNEPKEALTGLGLLAVGFPIYAIWKARSGRRRRI